MALSYQANSKLQSLMVVLDEHAEWLGHLMRVVFYPENKDADAALEKPQSFESWAKEAESNEIVEEATLNSMRASHDELHRSADKLVDLARATDGKVDSEAFDTFIGLYDDFIFRLRRLERDCMLLDSGLDATTGLRSDAAMRKDMEREMERLARRGRPFCLVLARIDNFDVLQKGLSAEEYAALELKAADLIRECVRSFDDAYKLDNGEYIMCLKQSDTTGASASIARLRRLLEESRIKITMPSGSSMPLTMSFCMAEPLPGDEVDELLTNMRADLSQYNEEGDMALEYFEQSPLQRFIDELETKKEAKG